MSVFTRRYRGFRVINLIGLGLLITMVLGVYLAKTFAWRERNEIAAVDVQIRQEKLRIRLLQAEVAHLEQPRRIEALAAGSLGMSAIGAKQEIGFADLPAIAYAKPKPAASASARAPTVVAVAQVAPGADQAKVVRQ